MRESIGRMLDGVHRRRFVLVLFDIICFFCVNLLFFLVAGRAANSVPVDEVTFFFFNVLIHMLFLLLFRVLLGIYSNIWRYANTKAYFSVVMSDAISGIVTVLFVRLIQLFAPGVYYGVWQAVVVGSLTALVTLTSRFVYSLVYKSMSMKGKSTKVRVPVAIVGAGQTGAYLAEDLLQNPSSGYEPLFFVDVAASKIGNTIAGIKVYDRELAHRLISELEIKEVLIAISTQDGEHLASLYDTYSKLGCRVRIFDSLAGSRDNEENTKVIRDFSIEDLLFRKPVVINDDNTDGFYSGKTVLITGGGGSIGSEICRRLAECSPAKIVIFDIYENNAYEVQQEMNRKFGNELVLAVEIGSIRDEERLEQVFEKHRPDVVFHAAAHKHVPLMEHCADEAVKNNVIGTYNAANAAEKYGVKKFILISTDKAVNPTSIMGASKRLCEMIIQCRTDSDTSFAAVRFGNVLGSNGSVIPLFKKQIEQGGPVTVTDKRIIRYFMTIPEAAQLVIQTGLMAEAGELFVLDMGKPVKIFELAENMIKLSGLVPGKDIDIVEIGLRPGEKLYEELLIKTETLDKTPNDLIFIERDAPLSRVEVGHKIHLLEDAMKKGQDIKAVFERVIPTYRDADEVNEHAEKAEEMKLVYA